MLAYYEVSEEYFLRREAKVFIREKVQKKWCLGHGVYLRLVSRRHRLNCSYSLTDEGYLGLPTQTATLFGFKFQDSFWNQNAQDVWDKLKVGRHYDVVIAGHYSTLKIVRVVRSLDAQNGAC
jgi:hypothetical protein